MQWTTKSSYIWWQSQAWWNVCSVYALLVLVQKNSIRIHASSMMSSLCFTEILTFIYCCESKPHYFKSYPFHWSSTCKCESRRKSDSQRLSSGCWNMAKLQQLAKILLLRRSKCTGKKTRRAWATSSIWLKCKWRSVFENSWFSSYKNGWADIQMWRLSFDFYLRDCNRKVQPQNNENLIVHSEARFFTLKTVHDAKPTNHP